MTLKDDVQQLADNQEALQKNFRYLKRRLDKLEKGMVDYDDEAVEEAEIEETVDRTSKETSQPIENLGFKAFGGVGFFLLLLGLFYLYRYAVDHGWIGILERIILGVILSIGIIFAGSIFRNKEYTNFGTLLTGGGVALLYFTFAATYFFQEYRNALGMTLGLNLVLLTITMMLAVMLAIRYKNEWLAAFSFILGYISAFLIVGIDPTLTMIYTLLFSAGAVYVITKRQWSFSIGPLLFSYLLFSTYFATNIYSRTASLGEVWMFLIAFFVLFVLQSLLLEDKKSIYLATTLLNAAAFFGFGIQLVQKQAEHLSALFAIGVAIIYLLQAFLAKDKDKLFETCFILCITFLTIAIPLQLEGPWVALLWGIEGLLLVNFGVVRKQIALRILGYIVLGLSVLGSLVLLVTESTIWRPITIAIVCVLLYLSARRISDLEVNEARYAMELWLSMIAAVLFTAMIGIEFGDSRGLFAALGENARMVLLSLVWAIEAIIALTVGFTNKVRPLRIFGAILFAIVVLKVLIVDVNELSEIARTIVTILVGLIALGAAFVYVKNKDRIEAALK